MYANKIPLQMNEKSIVIGRDIPFSKFLPTLTPEYHDIHHYEYNKNYGLMYTWIEKLFGTYSDGSHYSK